MGKHNATAPRLGCCCTNSHAKLHHQHFHLGGGSSALTIFTVNDDNVFNKTKQMPSEYSSKHTFPVLELQLRNMDKIKRCNIFVILIQI